MLGQIFELLGGLGVFLLGVVIMTSGLKGVAGVALQGALTRFTRSPASGAATGAVSTAILQSSSATIVAAVGFVGAGLLTFPQALGIILGANVGTTITGWMVALLGFKLKLGTVVLPLILAGVLLHLFARGRWSSSGFALAGFGLIFVGISTMQAGMSGLEGVVTPNSFPSDTLLGRLQLIAIGIGITLITQSSSAGVAASLTALHTGTISFEQAAALVIGMDIGTTATALIATLGGSTETRRTGYSHVVYNLMTGLGAFLLLSPYVWAWQSFAPGALYANAELALVGFHTGFNILGVLVILPFTHSLANFIIRLVPERGSALERHLDKHLLSEPGIALEAVRTSLENIHLEQLVLGQRLFEGADASVLKRFRDVSHALSSAQSYVDLIHLEKAQSREWQLLRSCMHSLDHMQRLQRRLEESERVRDWTSMPLIKPIGDDMRVALAELHATAVTGDWAAVADLAARLSGTHNGSVAEFRDAIMARVASGEDDTIQGNRQLEMVRWMRRVAEHLWRIGHHLSRVDDASFKETATKSAVDGVNLSQNLH